MHWSYRGFAAMASMLIFTLAIMEVLRMPLNLHNLLMIYCGVVVAFGVAVIIGYLFFEKPTPPLPILITKPTSPLPTVVEVLETKSNTTTTTKLP